MSYSSVAGMREAHCGWGRYAYRLDGRWVPVVVDDRLRYECATPSLHHTTYYVRGVGERSIRQCAEYARAHGISARSLRALRQRMGWDEATGEEVERE